MSRTCLPFSPSFTIHSQSYSTFCSKLLNHIQVPSLWLRLYSIPLHSPISITQVSPLPTLTHSFNSTHTFSRNLILSQSLSHSQNIVIQFHTHTLEYISSCTALTQSHSIALWHQSTSSNITNINMGW
jgi:hypothetical protein